MQSADIRQAVLLAAGSGSRLMPRTAHVPKAMVEVADRCIVDHLVDALVPLGIDEIVVVTGHCSDRLEQHLRDRGDVGVTAIFNERYATTNNILSLYLAREAIAGSFLLLESDVFAVPEVLAPLATPDTMIVAPYEATMDGTGVVLDDQGRATEMIIKAHDNAADRLARLHKTVNFYSFSAELWRDAYLPALAGWIQRDRLDHYYEAVLADLVNAGEISMRGADVGGLAWSEVDDEADLVRADALARAAD